MKKLHKVLLILVIFGLAFFLNFYRLGSVPSGLYVDEASNGYNSFSLLKTGKDEYGKSWPVAMRFLGSYSPPLYVYLNIPVVAVFGLNVWSVRLLSAVSGMFGVLVVWFFLRSFKFVRFKYIPYFGALLMTITPWNILFSRAGYEVYLGALLFWIGALFIWWGFRDSRWLILGFPILSLSTYGAHTERFLVPLFGLGVLVLFCRKLFKKRDKLFFVYGILLSIVIQIPNLLILNTPAWWNKGGLFYSSTIIEQADKYFGVLSDSLAWILAFGRKFGAQYVTYFSPRSLFFAGDSDLQRSMPDLSVFYGWMVVPYLVGLYLLWKKRKEFWVKYVLLLLFLSPIPAALTNDPFSTQRALPLLLPMVLVISMGMDQIISNFQKRKLLYCLIALFSIGSFVSLWRSYFMLLPIERSKVWGYGFRELAYEIATRPTGKFVIDQARIKPIYIELAFFMKFPPEDLQEVVDQSIKGNYYYNVQFNSEYKFRNIEIRGIVWEKDIYKEQILVGDALAISGEQANEHVLDEVFTVRDPMGSVLFRGFRTNPKKKCLLSVVKSVYCD